MLLAPRVLQYHLGTVARDRENRTGEVLQILSAELLRKMRRSFWMVIVDLGRQFWPGAW